MADKPAPRKERFEDLLRKVEEVVKALESGTLGLEDSLEQYEQGREALAKCHAILEQAEKRIELLVRQPDGSLQSQPLDAAAAKATEKPARKKKDDADLPF